MVCFTTNSDLIRTSSLRNQHRDLYSRNVRFREQVGTFLADVMLVKLKKHRQTFAIFDIERYR